jgi:hypothetical protein
LEVVAMTTAAFDRAPSVEEIRALLWRALHRAHPVGGSHPADWEAAWNNLEAMCFAPYELEDDGPEMHRLCELVEAAMDPVRDAAYKAGIEALVASVRQFAAEYPGAPRRGRATP